MPEQSVLPRAHWPSVIDVLGAITATMANDTHNGGPLDYERMETLGDSILKFICCMYLYFRYPSFFEGQLSLSKHYLVSNHNLWFRGLTGLQLGDYIRGVPFVFAGISLPGTGLPESDWVPQRVAVRGKVIGDVMEALLGVAYDKGGVWGTVAVAVHLHLLPPAAYELMQAYQHQPHVCFCCRGLSVHARVSGFCFGEMLLLFPASRRTTQLTTPHEDCAPAAQATEGINGTPASDTPIGTTDNDAPSDMPLSVQQQRTRVAVEQVIGYRFKDPALLFRALTHPSCHESGGSYQRLEYLGDAVLDLMIMHRACEHYLYVDARTWFCIAS